MTTAVKGPKEPMTMAQARASVKPGEKRLLEVSNGGFHVITGRVPYDGSTRQQRRAIKREAE